MCKHCRRRLKNNLANGDLSLAGHSNENIERCIAKGLISNVGATEINVRTPEVSSVIHQYRMLPVLPIFISKCKYECTSFI